MVIGGLLTAVGLALGVLRAGGGGGGDPRRGRRPDPAGGAPRARRPAASTSPGTLTLTGAMLLLVVTVVHAPEVAVGTTLATLAGAAVLLAAFVADRAPLGRPAGPARHPAVGPAGAGQRGRDAAGRLVHGLPVRRGALPAGAAGLVGGGDRARARRRRHRRGARPDPHPGAGQPVRQRRGSIVARARARRAGLRAVPAGRAGLDLRRDAAGVRWCSGSRSRWRTGR